MSELNAELHGKGCKVLRTLDFFMFIFFSQNVLSFFCTFLIMGIAYRVLKETNELIQFGYALYLHTQVHSDTRFLNITRGNSYRSQ